MAKKTKEETVDSPQPLRALILEDSPNDAKLAVRTLERGGYEVQFEVTDSAEVFREHLEQADYDVIVADFNLRGWTAFDALDILKGSGKDIPLIVSTGSLGDEAAAECIKRGAADFILKDRPARLPAAVKRALEERQLRTQRKQVEDALNEERHLLLTLMDNLPDVIYFKDRESRFTRVNQAQLKQFGLSDPAQAAGKTDFDFFTAEHAEEAYQDEQEIMRTGQAIVGKEEKETWSDGHMTWASTTKMPLRDARGNITGTFGISRDITGRKLAEESLRESEERFRATFEDAGTGMALVDTEGRPFKTNVALRKMLGYSEEEFSRMAFTEYTHPDDRELDWKLYDELAEGKREKYEIEKRFFKKDGGVVWGLLTVSLVKDKYGHPLCAVGMVQDVTERKQAEAALRESEHRYRTLFEGNLAGVFVTTWDGRILDCNQAMANILGFSSPQEALSQSVHELYVSAKDREVFLARLQAEGQLTNYEMHLRRQNGNPIWLIGNMSLLPQTATGLRIIEGTLIDITERKLTEAENARLAQVVNSSEDAIFSATRDGVIVTWNAGAQRMYGYTSEEVMGEHFSVLVPEEYRPQLARFEQRLLGGDSISHFEQEDLRKDGSRLRVSLTLSPIKDAAGAVTGVSVISRDITDRMRAEEAVRQSEEKYRSIVSNIPDVVWTLDANLHFVFISKNIEKMSGFTLEEIDRHGPALYLASLHPDDSLKVQEGLRALFKEGRPYDVEVRTRRKDGEWIWVHDRAVATYEKDGILFADGLLSDITERKRAEEALRRSEACLAAGESLTHTGSWSWDIGSGELFWSQETYRIFGFNPAKDRPSIGKTFLPRIHPDDRPRVEAGLQYPHGEDSVEYRIVLPDGSIRFIHDIAYPVTDAAGKTVQRFGVASDVTERKRADEALRQSEERFRQIAETIEEVFWTSDPVISRMLYISPAYERIWGRSCESLYENPKSFLDSIHPDDRERVVTALEAQARGESFEHEYRIITPDGVTRWIWDRGFPIRDEAGRVVRYVGVAVDISARKRAEAERIRLVTAIEQSAEAVVITKPSGEIEYVNPAFTRITGFSREDALGQNPRILKSERQDPAFYRQLWETILTGNTWSGELINQRKDGGLYTEQMSITPVKGVQGEITHFIATKQDVTERRTLEAQLQQAAKMEAVGRLAGGVAHDFNNLLTVINGYSEILLERLADDERAGAHLREIFGAGERAAALTRQLLAFSRRQVLAPRVLDLNVVVLNLEKMLRRLIGEDVKLRTNLDPHLERVKADPGQMEQVIMNLAVNARDAMPMGGNLILETGNVVLDEGYARNHPTVKPGPHVMLAVSDTGMGMSPETQARIFEPFFTTKEIGKGTGLGLATVYGIVKQSGGSIWVYSEIGQGTTFKVYLPIVGERQEEEAPMTAAKDLASGTETILVVEDEDGVRSLVRVALASGGYHVLEAKDAESALAICAGHSGPIQLLLTDVVMPQMSGPALAKKLTAIRHDLKVLYMSGYTDDAVVHHGVLSHDTPFIQKPFSPVALRKKIYEVLGGISPAGPPET